MYWTSTIPCVSGCGSVIIIGGLIKILVGLSEFQSRNETNLEVGIIYEGRSVKRETIRSF